ncbi:MAG: hypothetical protein HYW48_00010 [Deltaproteobacteria bacterium]|nr:hypothetical protein [Deltaproteobacteria bacterium]
MKKEYDLKTLKKRPGKPKVDREASKTMISIRIDGSLVANLKTEATRLGIPYQTLIGSVLCRYVSGELIDKQSIKWLKRA